MSNEEASANQRLAEKHIREVETKKAALGQEFYGYGKEGSGTASGFDFGHMVSFKRSWHEPVFYHSLNAAGFFGGGYGLYYFFAYPVRSKGQHVLEMVRRTLMGSLYAYPFCMGAAWWLSSRSKKSQDANLRNRGDTWRKEYLSEGGQTMSAPPGGAANAGIPEEQVHAFPKK
eukprot:Rhum_TRINITY_DN16732_c1_g1::Rhum_TRINITY_DN16732_c1_g1_i1::g.164218::m.164218